MCMPAERVQGLPMQHYLMLMPACAWQLHPHCTIPRMPWILALALCKLRSIRPVSRLCGTLCLQAVCLL